jgi:hypothetical protein
MDAAPGAHTGASSVDAPHGLAGAPAPLRGVPEASALDESLCTLRTADRCTAVEPVAARAGEKRSRDDNEDAGARKAAASAAAEQEEPGSGGAAAASPIATAADAPSADGAPFFDYAAESKALGDSLFRLPALEAQAGPSALLGSIGEFFGQFQRRSAELRARAVEARFYGFQPHERALALELLNRRRAVPSIRSGVAVADEAWDERQVKGNHRKPCVRARDVDSAACLRADASVLFITLLQVACEEPFSRGQVFYQECARGPWDADKLCEGCMGAKLRVRHWRRHGCRRPADAACAAAGRAAGRYPVRPVRAVIHAARLTDAGGDERTHFVFCLQRCRAAGLSGRTTSERP